MHPDRFFFSGWEPVLRILVVGTAAYVAIVLLVRIVGKRTLVQMNALDFILTVALGASFGRILTAKEVVLAEAITAFGLIVVLQYALTWLQVRSPTFTRTVNSPPALLFFRGNFLHDRMRRELVTRAELCAALREHGIGSFGEVEAIVLETDGRISVIRSDRAGDNSALGSLVER